jgi:hypothetical protein
MPNIKDAIKAEDKLNERIHVILTKAAQIKEALYNYLAWSKTVRDLKEAFKEAGYVRETAEYKLPLAKCETCKVKKHCIKVRQPSCPNELGGVK